MVRRDKWGLIALCAALVGAACDDAGRPGAGPVLPTTTGGLPDTEGDDATGTSAAPGTTGSDETGDGTSSGGDAGDAPKFDVPVDDTMGDACGSGDACCELEDGELPPHELLDAFILAYPAQNMPKSHPEVSAFEPEANGHAMAWSDENAADELIDSSNGGVIPENIEEGRSLSRAAAEAAIPEGSTVLEVREDPVVIEDLGGSGNCIGVGWGWGSILFEASDASMNEVVYLYVGYCDNMDIEAFYYSDQAAQICKPPG